MARPSRQKPQDTYEHIDHEEELLGSLLVRLQKVKGYLASAVMTFQGELLASHSSDKSIDLHVVARIFNDIFRNAHEATDKIGLKACQETVINTSRGIIAMRCSGVDAMIHFHILVIVSVGGNLALAKMELEKMVPLILTELA